MFTPKEISTITWLDPKQSLIKSIQKKDKKSNTKFAKMILLQNVMVELLIGNLEQLLI